LRVKQSRPLVTFVRVSLVQIPPAIQKPPPHRDGLTGWAASLPADVIVFPELATCGYMYEDRDEVAPFVEGHEALEPIAKIAKSSGRLIVGGFAELDDGAFYDSAFAAGPDGLSVYRKIHLWNRETLMFRPRTEPVLLEFQGHRIGLEICYDLQFPELAAHLARHGAELLLVPTAWAEEGRAAIHGLQ